MSLHQKLMSENQAYSDWHNNKGHALAHWGIFLFVAFIATSLIVNTINYFPDGNTDNTASAIEAIPLLSHSKQLPPAKDHILVKFKDNVGQTKRAEILKAHGLTEKSEIPHIGVKVVNIPTNSTPEDVVNRLLKNDKVSLEFAEVDAVLSQTFIPNDQYYKSGDSWHHPVIGSPQAWDITMGNPSVIISILDSGINCAHPDMSLHCVAGWNFYDNNSNTTDVGGHGTLVAATAAENGNNIIGAIGICPNCSIMPIRISNLSGGGSTLAIANGLVFAADKGVRIANISYGNVSKMSSINAAAQYFHGKGGLVMISAGNDSFNDATYDNPNFIMVSATDVNDTITAWSNTGNNIDISAPGANLPTASNSGGYGTGSGTSVASPVVAGVVGMMLSANPSLTVTQLENIIKQSANDLGSPGWDPQYGWGRVNSNRAVNLAIGNTLVTDTTPPPTPLNFKVTAPYNSLAKLSWSTTTNDSDVVGYAIYRDDVEIARPIGFYSATLSLRQYSDSYVTIGGTHTYIVRSFDSNGNLSSPTNPITVNLALAPTDTQPPNAPTGVSTQFLNNNATLRINFSPISDNVRVAGYKLYRDGVEIGTVIPPHDTSTFFAYGYNDLSVESNKTYSYYYKAYDSSNNYSLPSATVTITTPTFPSTDTVAPSAPTGLSATSTNSSTVKLTWNASADNVGVTGYKITRGGSDFTIPNITVAGAVTSTSYTDSSAVAGIAYTYNVQAYDAAGNLSLFSNPFSVRVLGGTPSPSPTPIVDTTPPGAPVATIEYQNTISNQVVAKWSTPTDNVGVVGYKVYKADGTLFQTLGPTPNYVIESAVAGKTFSYYVIAFDASANNSPKSNTVSITIPGTLDTTLPVTSITSPTNGQTVSGTVSVSAGATDDMGIKEVDLWKDGAPYLIDTTSPYTFSWNTTVNASGPHTLQTKAYDTSGNMGQSQTITVSVNNTSDSIPPSTPVLSASAPDSTKVNISWTASTDNVGVTGYKLYRDAVLWANLSGTTLSYVNTNITAGSTYSYYVVATDAGGNVSAHSNTVTVTVPAAVPVTDTTPPITSISSPSNGQTLSGTITISAAASDNVGVTKVELWEDGTLFGTDTTSPYSFNWDTTSVTNANHTVQTKAYDASSNTGISSVVTVTINNVAPPPPPPSDTTPPSSPTLSASAPDSTKVNLSWSASTDNVGVTGYKLYRDGTNIANVSGLTFTDTNVSAGSTYSYYLVANDAAGNVSTNSNTVSVTVPAVAPPPPPPPAVISVTSYTVSNKTANTATINWTTNLASTGVINYGLSNDAMTSSQSDTTSGTSHTITLTNLASKTNYYYQITVTSTSDGTLTSSPVSTFRTMPK